MNEAPRKGLDLSEIEPFFVCAFDPGGTTGWAIADYSPKQHGPRILFSCGQIGSHQHHLELYAWIRARCKLTSQRVHLVCEEFDFRANLQKSRVDLISREYIGIIKLCAAEADKIVLFENASTAKRYVPDWKIKSLGPGAWQPGQPHAMDAMRHLLYYMAIRMNLLSYFAQTWLNAAATMSED